MVVVVDGEMTAVNDIEYILNDIGGAFGKYQIFNYLMLSYSMFVTGTFVLDYVFATLNIPHRCRIDRCDKTDDGDTIFQPGKFLKIL